MRGHGHELLHFELIEGCVEPCEGIPELAIPVTIDQLVDGSLETKSDRMRQLLEGAELAPIYLADDPATDAEGNDQDLNALLRYLLGETV